MPSSTFIIVSPDCTAVLNPITEAESTLRQRLSLTISEETELATITHTDQRVEWLACRVAVRQLVEQQGWHYAGLQKDEFGKPHLAGYNAFISLSHTGGWASAVLHQSRPVGIDIEPMREKFTRVVPRILSEPEITHAAGDPVRLAMYWCAKESLYKLYGKRQLTFRQHLFIDPFPDGATQLTGHVRLPNHDEPLTICCYRTGPGLLAVAF